MVARNNAKPRFYQPVFFDPPKVERGPCLRNRNIYDAVKLGRLSLRAAAEEYQLSPTRIQQIVRHVEDFICRTGGGPTRTAREKLRLAEYVYRGRTDLDRAAAEAAYYDGHEIRTEKFVIRDNKIEDRHVFLKNTKFNPRFLEAANRIAAARQKFEDARPSPPEAKDMTAEERIREAGLITAEELKLILEEEAQEKELNKNQTPAHDELAREEDLAAVEPVVHPPAAEEAPPSVTAPQPPKTSDSLPQDAVATPSVAAAAPEPPKRKPRVIWELQHLTPGPGPVPPGEKLEIAVPRFDDFGRLRLTKMPCPELLDTFWETDSTGHRRWKPPIIVNGPPDMPCYQGVIRMARSSTISLFARVT